MNIKEYFDHIILFLKGNRNVALVNVDKRIISRARGGGYLRLRITFIDKSRLELREYVNDMLRKLSYSYNYTSSENTLLFRFDNAPHHKEIKTYPHHKHTANGRVKESKEKEVNQIKKEIDSLLSNRKIREKGVLG
ncbi:MAG: DUF6516 family protein [Candidatus Jordarchaeaceae archaeon]